MVKVIFAVRHMYTKDVYSALIAIFLLLNTPAGVLIGTLTYMVVFFYGMFYMGIRYGYLLEKKPVS